MLPRHSSSTTPPGAHTPLSSQPTLAWYQAGNSLRLRSLSSVLRKFSAGVESGTYPAAPKLEGMDVAAFAHMQDHREWEVRLTIALCLALEMTFRLFFSFSAAHGVRHPFCIHD